MQEFCESRGTEGKGKRCDPLLFEPRKVTRGVTEVHFEEEPASLREAFSVASKDIFHDRYVIFLLLYTQILSTKLQF